MLPEETLIALDYFLERGGVREVTPSESEWVVADAANWRRPYRMEWAPDCPHMPSDFGPWDPWRHFDEWHGRQEQVPVSLPAGPNYLTVHGSDFGNGLWHVGTWIQSGDVAGLALGQPMRIASVDPALGRITLSAGPYFQDNPITLVAREPQPESPPRSRVPAHVAANRRRLDGRRRY